MWYDVHGPDGGDLTTIAWSTQKVKEFQAVVAAARLHWRCATTFLHHYHQNRLNDCHGVESEMSDAPAGAVVGAHRHPSLTKTSAVNKKSSALDCDFLDVTAEAMSFTCSPTSTQRSTNTFVPKAKQGGASSGSARSAVVQPPPPALDGPTHCWERGICSDPHAEVAAAARGPAIVIMTGPPGAAKLSSAKALLQMMASTGGNAPPADRSFSSKGRSRAAHRTPQALLRVEVTVQHCLEEAEAEGAGLAGALAELQQHLRGFLTQQHDVLRRLERHLFDLSTDADTVDADTDTLDTVGRSADSVSESHRHSSEAVVVDVDSDATQDSDADGALVDTTNSMPSRATDQTRSQTPPAAAVAVPCPRLAALLIKELPIAGGVGLASSGGALARLRAAQDQMVVRFASDWQQWQRQAAAVWERVGAVLNGPSSTCEERRRLAARLAASAPLLVDGLVMLVHTAHDTHSAKADLLGWVPARLLSLNTPGGGSPLCSVFTVPRITDNALIRQMKRVLLDPAVGRPDVARCAEVLEAVAGSARGDVRQAVVQLQWLFQGSTAGSGRLAPAPPETSPDALLALARDETIEVAHATARLLTQKYALSQVLDTLPATSCPPFKLFEYFTNAMPAYFDAADSDDGPQSQLEACAMVLACASGLDSMVPSPAAEGFATPSTAWVGDGDEGRGGRVTSAVAFMGLHTLVAAYRCWHRVVHVPRVFGGVSAPIFVPRMAACRVLAGPAAASEGDLPWGAAAASLVEACERPRDQRMPLREHWASLRALFSDGSAGVVGCDATAVADATTLLPLIFFGSSSETVKAHSTTMPTTANTPLRTTLLGVSAPTPNTSRPLAPAPVPASPWPTRAKVPARTLLGGGVSPAPNSTTTKLPASTSTASTGPAPRGLHAPEFPQRLPVHACEGVEAPFCTLLSAIHRHGAAHAPSHGAAAAHARVLNFVERTCLRLDPLPSICTATRATPPTAAVAATARGLNRRFTRIDPLSANGPEGGIRQGQQSTAPRNRRRFIFDQKGSTDSSSTIAGAINIPICEGSAAWSALFGGDAVSAPQASLSAVQGRGEAGDGRWCEAAGQSLQPPLLWGVYGNGRPAMQSSTAGPFSGRLVDDDDPISDD